MVRNEMSGAKSQGFGVLEALANELKISDGYRWAIALPPFNEGVLNRRSLWVLLQLNRQGISEWGMPEAMQKTPSQVVGVKRRCFGCVDVEPTLQSLLDFVDFVNGLVHQRVQSAGFSMIVSNARR